MTTAPIVVVGDAIVDAIVETLVDNDITHEQPGGAALNVAVGLAILGHPVAQVAAVGLDSGGDLVRAHLAAFHVLLLESDTASPTGVATSRRINGEPSYAFTDSMLHRHLAPSRKGRAAIAAAPAVVVSAFPFDDAEQTAALLTAITACRGLRVVDPNPRLALVNDIAAFRRGVEAAAAVATLLKVSDEDLDLLYGSDAASAVDEFPTPMVLITHGAGGATLLQRDRSARREEKIHVPAADLGTPVTDTLGAGDATVAAVVDGLLRVGVTASPDRIQEVLHRAMVIAGATARAPGGLLRLG